MLDGATITILATSISGLIITVTKVVTDYKREVRNHRWDIEQRMWDRKERLRVAEELKAHTADTTRVITAKIDENTAVNEAAIAAGEKAYTEANNLSIKIQQQGLELRQPSRSTDKEGVNP